VGLCLNASKVVSSLVKGGNDIFRNLVSQKARNNMTLLGSRSTDRSSHEHGLPYGAIARRDLTATTVQRTMGPNKISCFKKGYNLEISIDFDAFFFFKWELIKFGTTLSSPIFEFYFPSWLDIKWLNLEDLQSNGIDNSFKSYKICCYK